MLIVKRKVGKKWVVSQRWSAPDQVSNIMFDSEAKADEWVERAKVADLANEVVSVGGSR